MENVQSTFSGYSSTNLKEAEDFYVRTLGLSRTNNTMGLELALPGGGKAFIYEKPDHVPATFTVLNFVVADIDAAVDQLSGKGITFEHYDLGNGAVQDEKAYSADLRQIWDLILPGLKTQQVISCLFYKIAKGTNVYGRYSKISLGWQLSASQIDSSVDRRIAFAFPFFNIDILAMVIPTFSDSSVTLILRLASITSIVITIAILFRP